MSTREASLLITADLAGYNNFFPPYAFHPYTGVDICNGTGMTDAEWGARNEALVGAPLVEGQTYRVLLHFPNGPDGNPYEPVIIAGIEQFNDGGGFWVALVPLTVAVAASSPYGYFDASRWFLRVLNPAVHDSNAAVDSLTVIAWPGWGSRYENSGYYLLAYTPHVTAEPYLRMQQRNDGLGPNRHPRLPASRSGHSSIQAATGGTAAPRVARGNRYR